MQSGGSKCVTADSVWVRALGAGLAWMRRAVEPFKGGKATIFVLHRSNRVHPGIRGHDPEQLGLMLRQMRRAGFRLVSVAELTEAARIKQQLSGDLVAFTMDDGFADQADVLAPIFLEENVPLTLFVVTGFLDGILWPWDSQVSDAFLRARGAAISVPVGRVQLTWDISSQPKRDYARRECLELCRRLSRDQLADAIRALRHNLPDGPPFEFQPMSWARARELERDGIVFGSHTASHRIVSGLESSEVHAEVESSMQRLNEELTQPAAMLAWPIGRTTDFSTRDLAIAASHGVQVTLAVRDVYDDTSGQGEHVLFDRYSLPHSRLMAYRYASGAEMLRARLPIASRRQPSPVPRLKPPRTVRESIRHWRRRKRLAQLQDVGLDEARHARALVGDRIRWPNVQRVIFACKGNLCRSPYAEVKARHLGIDAASVGVFGIPQKPAEPRAVLAALLCGVDMSAHRSNSLATIRPGATDLVLCMDPDVEREVKIAWAPHSERITLLGLWDPGRPRQTIADPFGGDLELFFRTFSMIDRCLGKLAADLARGSDVARSRQSAGAGAILEALPERTSEVGSVSRQNPT